MSHPNVEPLYDSVVIAILKQQGVDISYVPRNLYQPESLYDALERYDPECSSRVDFNDDAVKAGRNFAFRCFAKEPGQAYLKPVRLDGDPSEIYKLLNINGKASAGLTAYGYTKAEAFSVAMRKVPEVLNGKAPDPCLAGCRTQAGKTGRLVWMYPYVMTLIEGCLARPLINHFLSAQSSTMAFGMRSSCMGAGMRAAASHNDYYVSMDASKFDTTISAGMIKSAFAALRTWFDPRDEVGFGHTVMECFDIIEDYFIHTPIVMPSTSGPLLYSGKKHGVPSGSYYTQLVDSFVNTAMVGALDRRFHLGIRREEVWVLGDDMLFFIRKAPQIQSYANFLQTKFGMNMNAKKSKSGSVNEGIHFLGRTWYNGLPYREFEEVVQRSVAPESYRKYVDRDKEARLVLWSYRNSSLIRNAPQDLFLVLPCLPGGEQKYHTGYMEFLQKERMLSMRPCDTLF
jgi:hypothetical protein